MATSWNKTEQRGRRQVIGGLLDIVDGGELNIETGGALKIGGTAVAATAAELNAAADVSGRLVSVPDAATYTFLAANSGKPHVIPDLTADCTFTFDSFASGVEYELIYGGIAADAQDWIIDAEANVNFYLGGVVHLDTNAGSAGDEVVPIAGDGNSNSIFTVLTPEPGTRFKLLCDGTNVILSGFVASATVPIFADQA